MEEREKLKRERKSEGGGKWRERGGMSTGWNKQEKKKVKNREV